ncbi:hypothetical protein BS50DRAFT_102508 [Corynespora cassiicola Philippines]|uniref:Secreted protein n=1 Tax=Corynespora cassiicola Philippines TaxID=1448308 RepID=A0A2T2NCQ8_CORCC|nr:hypothetical protein BS50DRAFT_102508 [Corynespora cassiicola Philippines]
MCCVLQKRHVLAQTCHLFPCFALFLLFRPAVLCLCPSSAGAVWYACSPSDPVASADGLHKRANGPRRASSLEPRAKTHTHTAADGRRSHSTAWRVERRHTHGIGRRRRRRHLLRARMDLPVWLSVAKLPSRLAETLLSRPASLSVRLWRVSF